MIRRLVTLLAPVLLVIGPLSSCMKKLDQSSVQASLDVPVAAQVAPLEIPLNSEMGLVYLSVEPVKVKGTSFKVNSTSEKNKSGAKASKTETKANTEIFFEYLSSRQAQITSQLISSLSGVKNFKVMDYEHSKRAGFKATKGANDQGLYLVRATITEYDETVTGRNERTNVPAVLTQENAEYTGVMGLDVSVVSAESGEIIDSFPVQGSFTTKVQKENAGLLLTVYSTSEFARSSSDQALRVALNNSAKTLYERFNEKSTAQTSK